MVLLTTTPRIHDAFTLYRRFCEDDITDISTSIPHTDLHRISLTLRSHFPANDAYTLTSLLRGTSVYTPPPPPPPTKTPEYLALMARLRLEADKREYNALLTTPTTHAYMSSKEEEEMTWREVKGQISVIFNILLSTLATAGAVWKVAGGWDVPERMAAAFASAIVVAVAEVVLFGSYVRRLEQAKVEEGKEREKKGVVRVLEVGLGAGK